MRALRVQVYDSQTGHTRNERYTRSPVRIGRHPSNELCLSFGFVKCHFLTVISRLTQPGEGNPGLLHPLLDQLVRAGGVAGAHLVHGIAADH